MTGYNHKILQLFLIGLQLTSLHCEVVSSKNHCANFDIGPKQGSKKDRKSCGRYHVLDSDREISLVAFRTARECQIVEKGSLLRNGDSESNIKFVVTEFIQKSRGDRLIVADLYADHIADTRLLIFCTTSELAARKTSSSSKRFVEYQFDTITTTTTSMSSSTRVVKYLVDSPLFNGPLKTEIKALMRHEEKRYFMAGAGMGGGLAVVARLLWSDRMGINPGNRLMTFSTPIIGNDEFYTVLRNNVPFAKYLRFDYCGSPSIKAIKMNAGQTVILGKKKTYFAHLNREPYLPVVNLCKAERRGPLNPSGWTVPANVGAEFNDYVEGLTTFIKS